MDWDDYRFFLVVTNAPSIRAAAIKLAVSHSTVLRHIDRLEDNLNTRLFDRTPNGFKLTSAGEDVLRSVREIEESVQTIDRDVTGQDSALKGLVKVTMPDVMTHPCLFPNLAELKSKFPNIKLNIELSYDFADLNKREADIAIRITNKPPEDLVGRKVGACSMAAYATQQYVDQHAPFKTGSTAQLIGYGNPDTWTPRHGFKHLSVVGFYDNVALQFTLAKAHMGIASLPTYIADRDKELVRISEPSVHRDIWVLYHTDLRYTSRVRVVRDFFEQSLRATFSEES